MTKKRSERDDAGWPFRVLACPRCAGRLSAAQNLVRCASCGPFPLLGDVPLLVPDPAHYCATFHDAILAALAEHGLASREAVHVVRAFAQGAQAEVQRFADDWTEAEASGEAPPQPVRGVARAAVLALNELNLREGPQAWVSKHVRRVPLAVELGCGAGQRSEMLAHHASQLLVTDLSLRAVLHARARAARGLADIFGVVLDASALPFANDALPLVVAENVVDLLDEPLEFFEGLRRALAPKGKALLTSPDPSLGSGDDVALKDLAVRAKLKVLETRDGLPWLRANSSRFIEVYLAQAMLVSR